MSTYPTPPLTTSPKHISSFHDSPPSQAQTYENSNSVYTQAHSQIYENPNSSYTQAHSQVYEHPNPSSFSHTNSYNAPPKAPAQDSYHHAPSSPLIPTSVPVFPPPQSALNGNKYTLNQEGNANPNQPPNPNPNPSTYSLPQAQQNTYPQPGPNQNTYSLPQQHPNSNSNPTSNPNPYPYPQPGPDQSTYALPQSTLPGTYPNPPFHASPPSPKSPPSRRATPKSHLTPTRVTPPPRTRSAGNPNYYTNSPLPVSYTPYNASRPRPRPGLLRRFLLKIKSWMRALKRWSKRNPWTAGILTFLPLLTLAGMVKLIRIVGKGIGVIDSGGWKKTSKVGGSNGMEGEFEMGENKDRDRDRGVFDSFAGFGGSKGGPLEGILKIVQMLV